MSTAVIDSETIAEIIGITTEVTVADLEAAYAAREAELVAEFEDWKKHAIDVAKNRRRADGWCSTFLTAMAEAGLEVKPETRGEITFILEFSAGEDVDQYTVERQLREFLSAQTLTSPDMPEGIVATKPLYYSYTNVYTD